MDQPTSTPAVLNIRARLESCFQRMERILETLENDPDNRTKLAGAAEMRKHVALAARTLEIALRADALRDFQASVLDILAEADVKTRRKVMGLFEARAEHDNPQPQDQTEYSKGNSTMKPQ